MKRLLVLTTLICLLGSVHAQDRSIKFTHGTWAEISALAAKENKLIYVDCFTTWCGPCKWLAKNIFTNNEVADFYSQNFICAEIDMEKGEGIELAKKWGVRGYPSAIFCDAKSEIVHRSCGVDYREDYYKDFIQLGKNAMDPTKQFSMYKKMVDEGKASNQQHANYISLLASSCLDYTADIKKYFSLQKDADLLNRFNWKLIYTAQWDIDSREIKYLVANKAAFQKLYTNDSVDTKISQTYDYAFGNFIRESNMTKYELLKKDTKKSGLKEADKIIAHADMNLYSHKKDWVKYAKAAATYADKYAKNSASELNEIAWIFYENVSDKKSMANAERWSKHAVELSPVYSFLDTYAAVLYKNGKLDEAKKQAQLAIDVAAKENINSRETQNLLDKINSTK